MIKPRGFGLVAALARFTREAHDATGAAAAYRQRHHSRPLSFFDRNSHSAAAEVAEPKIFQFVLVSVAAFTFTFYLRDKELAVVKSEKLRGTRGIGALVEHLNR